MGNFDPDSNYLCGYGPNDGTVEFYSRIKAFARPEHVVLDLGAGRGAWFDEDSCEYRRQARLLKGRVREVIAADVDDIVLKNKSSDRNILINKVVPLPDQSVDIVIADYVLEHVQEPCHFSDEVRRLLKPGGLFCARTPHKYCYVALAARAVPNNMHASFLKKIQGNRESIDIFPTVYKMNTLKSIKKFFPDFEDYTYTFRADPAYYFGSKLIYGLQNWMHQITPAWFSGNLFIYAMRK